METFKSSLIFNGLVGGNCHAFQTGSDELAVPISDFPKAQVVLQSIDELDITDRAA